MWNKTQQLRFQRSKGKIRTCFLFLNEIDPLSFSRHPDSSRLKIVVDQIDQPTALLFRNNSKKDAIAFGATGGTGRASGWACDVRKRHPYGVYDKVDFKEIVYTEGDSWARYMVRMDEIMESMNILEQLIDNIPEGPYQEKMKPIIRVPEGQYYTAVEGSRGEFGVFLESHGDKTPYRLHFRSTGLPLVSTVDTICRGAKIADLIAIGGTLDYVVPDIDR